MKNSTVKTVGIMMAITLIGKIMGLGREILFGFHYGTETVEAAAFIVANQIPKNFLDAMFASVVSASFIPVFNDYFENKGRDEAYKLSCNFISIMIIATTLLTVLGIIFAYPIVNWYASGYTEEALQLAYRLLIILFPLLIISAVAFSITGILQSMGEFNIPSAMSVLSNSVIIFYYFFLIDRFGIYELAVAFIVGWLFQIIIQIPFLIKNQFRFRFFISFKDPGIKHIMLLMLPVMVSTWIQPINMMINTRFASRLFEGSGAAVSALNYASTLYTVITGVFILSVANFVFPKLSKLNTTNDAEGFSETLRTTLHSMFFFLIPMTFGIAILSEPLVRLIFQIEGGEFTEFSTYITSRALLFYSFGAIGLGIQTILLRGFYALKDGVTPLITGLSAILVNFAITASLIDVMGVGGPALASSVSLITASIIMMIVMNRKKNILNKHLVKDIAKMLVASLAMSVAVVIARDYILSGADTILNRIFVLVVPAFIGIAIYFAVTCIANVSEAVAVKSIIVKKIKS